jgi:hypothetical protein
MTSAAERSAQASRAASVRWGKLVDLSPRDRERVREMELLGRVLPRHLRGNERGAPLEHRSSRLPSRVLA